MEKLIVNKPFIKNPFITEMLSLFDSLRYKNRHFGFASCVLITGESGSGKSALAKYYVKNNPVVEQEEKTNIPVLHFELKKISTPLQFLRSLLIAIGDPQEGKGAKDQTELYDRLVKLIGITGVELLILDEIQVIFERRSEKVISGIADIFKDLINDTEIPIVFMGMPWSKYLVDSNKQLKRRIKYRYVISPYRISQKEFRDDYRRLLKMLSDAYQLSNSIKLEELSNTYRFFSATEGNLSATSDLVCEAYMKSKMNGKPVDLCLLADVLSDYGVTDDANPFVLPLDKIELRELVVNSDWQFGCRTNKNPILDAEYAVYGITKQNKIISIDAA